MARNAEETLGNLQKLNAALIANAATLPNLEAERQRFNEMVNATLEAFTHQGSLTSEKQEASQVLQNLLSETSRLATSLRFSVKSLYGIRSEKLGEFGMKRKRPANRRRAGGGKRWSGPGEGTTPGGRSGGSFGEE